MVTCRHNRTWRRGGIPGWLLALLALVSQLALGGIVLPDEAAAQESSVAALEALTVLCDSSAPTPPDVPRRHQRGPDAAMCPAASVLALAAVILTPAPALPPLTRQVAAAPALPPTARGPPAAPPRYIPASRGPPVLS